MSEITHRCDELCTCPADGKGLLYSPAHKVHACPDPQCEHAHGLTAEAELWGSGVHYTARQCGKTSRMREWIAEQEATGAWVAVASSKDGIRCSRCERDIDECRGSCMEQP